MKSHYYAIYIYTSKKLQTVVELDHFGEVCAFFISQTENKAPDGTKHTVEIMRCVSGVSVGFQVHAFCVKDEAEAGRSALRAKS